MENCVICGVFLDEQNRTKEHSIHNAIGSNLEDDKIYCKSCNEKCGSNQDRKFAEIFAPIVNGINMHKTRKRKGTSYTGTMCDQDGTLYTATYKASKIVKLENSNSEYVKYEKGKFKLLYYHFKINNEAFKLDMSKIAFNYAVHCGLHICHLDKILTILQKD